MHKVGEGGREGRRGGERRGTDRPTDTEIPLLILFLDKAFLLSTGLVSFVVKFVCLY